MTIGLRSQISILSLVVAGSACVAPSGPPDPTDSDTSTIQAGVDAYLAPYLDNLAPNEPETRFQIGSISKSFTAAAILLLRDRGDLPVR